nr:hypothetical protein [Micromonospora sp. DSM 115978]
GAGSVAGSGAGRVPFPFIGRAFRRMRPMFPRHECFVARSFAAPFSLVNLFFTRESLDMNSQSRS